ncbi:EAL domain-containing protein [Polymorphobacter sp. PAMC 29334]|uniref:putative bifunctional diguanylate cyclase/phosphodiesterase n=1 Tax=Polymorphobacter sp. PAMC 29334 TaxID=2862331 RepID=UPI001C771E3C|nr:EAL domain-containing protein [Polymorphobacter sp. PAMC 29334]QYE33794.1 EAL domain-containing protein [Polymorphobacter sp. PAMC 29334]
MSSLTTEDSGRALAAISRPLIVTSADLPDNPIVYVNSAFTDLCGYTMEEVVGRNCRFLNGPDSDPAVRADIGAALAAGRSIRREILNYRKDGTTFWNDVTIDPIRDSAGKITGYIGIQQLADAARRASEDKADAEARLASIADRLTGYIYRRVMRTDGSIEIVYCSPSIYNVLGIEGGEAARTFYDHVHPDDLDALVAAVRDSAARMTIFREEFRLIAADGAVHWLRSDAPPRRMANGDIIWDGLAMEISAEKRWESEIANHALRDPLTGLLTRNAWRQALARQLDNDGNRPKRCAVLCVGIEAFGDISDALGQHMGDEILCETARRVAEIAETVAGVTTRLAGDEFAIMVPECIDEASLSSLAISATEALARPFYVGAHQMTIETGLGAALSPDAEPGAPAADDLASELIMRAELALRWSRQEGRNAHTLYTRERDDRFQNRALLAQSLEQAIAKDELELHYQPLVDLRSGRIVSAEALVRWNHPVLGVQRPDLFIPLAEASGLMMPLGRWVIEQAMRQRQRWQAEGLTTPPIAINVSGSQLLDPDFISIVKSALRSTGANAADFEIEMTEGLLIEPSPLVVAALTALRKMGFTIAIDDFGSGHATFRYLRDFKVDKLKIDQMFVRKLVLGSTDALIIRAVISLARSMGIGFVTEGIETETQRAFLAREGCEIGQGYLFSIPLVAEDFAWLLMNEARLPLRAPDRHPTAQHTGTHRR